MKNIRKFKHNKQLKKGDRNGSQKDKREQRAFFGSI